MIENGDLNESKASHEAAAIRATTAVNHLGVTTELQFFPETAVDRVNFAFPSAAVCFGMTAASLATIEGVRDLQGRGVTNRTRSSTT